jgi:hypothetical protein
MCVTYCVLTGIKWLKITFIRKPVRSNWNNLVQGDIQVIK